MSPSCSARPESGCQPAVHILPRDPWSRAMSDAVPPIEIPAPEPPPSERGATPPEPPTWEPLGPLERRVLGVLIEKQKTGSGDTYPMSVNGVVTGCNQKSN